MLILSINGQKKIMVTLQFLNGIFIKFLINKEGKIHDTFGSFTEPLSIKITKNKLNYYYSFTVIPS